ncbi:hypothetical protein AGMMS50233_10950 [Endomicrobiia bacterium]|nr:hypothetical protein AGMMS50233_10950 [Endomicrobiia bacterium]
MLADAEKAQDGAERVAMTDENAAWYWRYAQHAWFELEKVAKAKAEKAEAKVNEAEARAKDQEKAKAKVNEAEVRYD